MIQNKISISEEGKSEVINTGNNLFPVFLKLETLRVLIIGGGNVGLEKLQAVIQNSPGASVKLVSVTISEKILKLINDYSNVTIEQRTYVTNDMDNADIVIA